MQAEADPNQIVYFGGEYVPLREARIGILTHALHYGTGVFEGIRGYWDEAEHQLFLVRPLEHYQRWKQNCGILRIGVPVTAGHLTEITAVGAAECLPHRHLCAPARVQVCGTNRREHRRPGCFRSRGRALRRVSAQ